jgi:predicted secreted protein
VAGRSTNVLGAGGFDWWVLKLDADGNVDWQKLYGGSSDDQANSIQETSDGGFIVAGETQSFGAGSSDYWVLKLDADGNVIWQKAYGGDSVEVARSIQETSDGGFIVAGRTYSYGASNYDGWVLKLDASGNVDWQKTYEGSYYDYAESIQETSDGGFIVAGYTNNFLMEGWDFWVLKLDANGNIPNCNLIQDTSVVPVNTSVTPATTVVVPADTDATVNNTSVDSMDTDAFIDEQCFYDEPFSDITANGSDGPVVITTADTLSLEIALDPGNYSGYPADWWVLANSPFGWYYYHLSSGWLSGQDVTYQGPLSFLSDYEVCNMSLPEGFYRFYFGIDGNMNGAIDMGQMYYDSVEVTVTP